MAGTITLRVDAATAQALRVLTRDGTSRTVAIRQALLAAARERARAELSSEAQLLARDVDDRAHAAQVLRDMEILRAS